MNAVVLSSGWTARGGEEDLCRMIAHGRPGAFDELVQLYQARIARLAYRLLGWSGDVEDVVQDVFLSALQKAHQFRAESSIWTWLSIITVNRCRTQHRKQRVRQTVHRILSRRPQPAVAGSDCDAARDELGREVRSAVAALAPRDREVIVLHYLEHKSPAQIAELVGASPNAVEVRLHRARSKLRKALTSVIKD